MEETQVELRALAERVALLDKRSQTLHDEVQRLAAEARKAREDAARALVQSDGSMHELKTIGDGLVRHVDGAVVSLLENTRVRTEVLGQLEDKIGDHDKNIQSLLDEWRRQHQRERAKSELKLEYEAEQAAAMIRAAYKRKVVTWLLGTLFVAAQTAQLLRNLWH